MTRDANLTTSAWLDGKRNGLRQCARLLVRNLNEDMQGYTLKVMTRKLHRCVIAFLFQLYLINTLKYALVSQHQILPTFFKTCFHARALPLPTRNCIPNSHNTLALDLKMSKTPFFGGSKCRQFFCACHIWRATIFLFLVCFLSSHS